MQYFSGYKKIFWLVALVFVLVGILIIRQNNYSKSSLFPEITQNQNNDLFQQKASHKNSDHPGLSTYTDTLLGFSFKYPSSYVPTAFDDYGGRVVLLKNQSKELLLQVFVSERKDNAPVTLEEIKSIADIRLVGSKNVKVGKEQIPGIAFAMISPSGVSTEEVWFSREKLLYQISAYRNDAPLIPLIESLKW